MSDLDNMNVWCMGCGEEHLIDPVDVVGLGVLMLCERCYRDLASAPDEVNDTAVCQTCHGDGVQLMGHDLGGRVKVLGAPCPGCCTPDEVNEAGT